VLGVCALACGGSDRTAGDEGEAGAARHGDERATAEADAAIRRAMADSGSWPSYGRDYTNRRYSPLRQITPANAAQLALAWKYETGIHHSFEASPVVVGGTMYVSTPLNHVVALDAATGRKKWEYVHEYDGPTVHCCGPVSRGVAVYGGRVYMGALDARLVALDAESGNKVWDVRVGDNTKGYSINAPPVAADGKVIIGVGGGEYGIRGYVAAYDAAGGDQIWRFYTIPSPEEGGWWGEWAPNDPFGTPLHRDIAREKADSAKTADSWQRGGGGVWQAAAIDTALGLVIFTVGNPSPDLNGSGRPGDNLYTDAIVAIGLEDGKHRWHHQTIPHDVWDLDAASPVVLVDVPGPDGGAPVPAVAHAGKTGWVYVVDRKSGKPIRRSDAFVPMENMFALPTPKGTRMLPGANGGAEWSPAAFSPETGYLYVLALHQPMLYKVAEEPFRPPAMWLGGAFVGTGEAQYGLFVAVDLGSGKVAWQNKVKDPMIGGALATAGGVVFTGTNDQQVLAFDAKSGKQVWTYKADGGVNAPPISYAVNGRQFVAVAAGGNYQLNTPRNDDLLVFALPSGGGQAEGAQ
jgi:PQQ-dependent dehydrogenase (methanol/ethanol family)